MIAVHSCCSILYLFVCLFCSGQDTDAEEIPWSLAVHSHHLQEWRGVYEVYFFYINSWNQFVSFYSQVYSQVYGFYKGMSMPITTVSISSSVVFGTYRNALQVLHHLQGKSADTPSAKQDIFLAGFAGGIAQVPAWSAVFIYQTHRDVRFTFLYWGFTHIYSVMKHDRTD